MINLINYGNVLAVVVMSILNNSFKKWSFYM